MKKGFLLAVLLLLLTATNYAQDYGPDNYGYFANNVTCPWIDITTRSGAQQITGLADDNAVGQFPMGITFRYYWTDYTDLKIGSNGWVSFDNVPNISHCFPTFPTPGGNGDNLLGPFLTDLNFAGAANPGEVWMWNNGTDTCIVSYINAPFWVNANPDYTGSNTFQIIFAATDSSIHYNYGTMETTYNDVGGCASDNVVGFENLTGNIGLMFFQEVLPVSNTCIKIQPPATPLLTIPDATPFWNANTDNEGQLELKNDVISLETNIKNVGNGDITNDITVIGKLENLAFQAIWRDTVVISGGLTVGSDQTITFPKQVTLVDTGQYYFTVTSATAGGQDQNPSNNNNVVELTVVSCDEAEATLTYATGNPPDGVIAWNGGGGNDGAGIFVVPPAYPTTINSVDMYIALGAFNPANNSGFTVQIIDDDGPAGTGTVLGTETVAQGAYTPNSIVNIPMTTPIDITSGGFYVSWLMGADSVALGTEAFGPISRRTYEILSGSWAKYRLSTAEDFLIFVNVDTSGYCLTAVGMEEDLEQYGFALNTFPNPANTQTTFEYTLAKAGDVTLNVTDLFGREVARFVFENEQAGTHRTEFDVTRLNSGIYFLNMQVGDQMLTRKLVVER